MRFIICWFMPIIALFGIQWENVTTIKHATVAICFMLCAVSGSIVLMLDKDR